MVLVLFESELYISSVMFIEKKKKILCMMCLEVIMMSICEMRIKSRKSDKKEKKRKNESVDALIVHVVRLVGLNFEFLTALQVALKDIEKTCGTRHNENKNK